MEKLPLRGRGHGVVRRLFLKPKTVDLIDGKWAPPEGFPTTEADVVIGRYCAGFGITISQKSARRVDLEKLEGLDEAWALCFRKPRPGWRILGRFIEKDVFVGMAAYDRHELGAVSNYTRLATEMISNWENTLLGIDPVRGDFPNDYLSGVLSNADI